MITDCPPYDPANAPDYLLIGASAISNLNATNGRRKQAVRSLDDTQRRAYDRTTRKSWTGRMKAKRVG